MAHRRIVYAGWSLIAPGAEAIPFAVRLVRSTDEDEREAGTNVFCGLRDPGRVTEIVGEITAALAKEPDHQVIDSLLGALGHLGSREALPAIARILINPSEDSDTRFTAADSLGRIIKRKFGKNGADAVQEACAWLRSLGYHEP